ncbi:MAG: LON peptidase substrate-binding domain-containing protein [Polaromonas sp.]|nr:LON peptidase substrate-binding domain-containing protein [Polaromonas sp.]
MADVLKLNSLPLFPLGTVLYPGGLLPLQIFEVRYLDMISRCHKAGAPFGVISLVEGSEVRLPKDNGPSGDGFAVESFGSVGTLATIAELTVPQPGLMVVRCVGQHRFKISSREKLRHGLWIANVTRLDEDMAVTVPYDLQRTANALGKIIKSMNEREAPSRPSMLLPPYRLDDCGWVANRWCELLPMPAPLKQRLMELDNPLVRLELVTDMLDRSGIATAR